MSARDGALPLDKFPPGTVEALKREGESSLFRDGPRDSVVSSVESSCAPIIAAESLQTLNLDGRGSQAGLGDLALARACALPKRKEAVM